MVQDGSPRILIVRLSHIGDAVLTLPVANQLRQVWPEAYLAWVAEPATASFLNGHPAVDEFLTVPKGWVRSWRNWRTLRREIRRRRFDVAVDPQSLLKSALIPWWGGISRRIGFDGSHGREGSRWLNNERVLATSSHLVDRSLELLLPLGISRPPSPQFNLPVDPAAVAAWESWFRQWEGRTIVTVNPGAGWASRRWPPDRFGAVARWLAETRGWLSIVAWAGAEEERMAREVVARAGGGAVMAPRTDLRQLTALLALSRYYLGGDTGPMHLAAVVGTPCIVLYGPTRPEDSGAYGAGHLAIISRHGDSGKRSARRSRAAIESIAVDEVIEAIGRYVDAPCAA